MTRDEAAEKLLSGVVLRIYRAGRGAELDYALAKLMRPNQRRFTVTTPAEQALRLLRPRKTNSSNIEYFTDAFERLGTDLLCACKGSTPEQTIAIRKLVEAKQAAIMALGEDEES